jgi:DNA-directed RNA polymerase specialized sigma24 family protein
MHRKNATRDAHIRELVYRERLSYAAAAERAGLTTGTVAGVAFRTPHRLRAILTAAS